jgi:hypothetical protein
MPGSVLKAKGVGTGASAGLAQGAEPVLQLAGWKTIADA